MNIHFKIIVDFDQFFISTTNLDIKNDFKNLYHYDKRSRIKIRNISCFLGDFFFAKFVHEFLL